MVFTIRQLAGELIEGETSRLDDGGSYNTFRTLLT
jgi:hypothetical protein